MATMYFARDEMQRAHESIWEHQALLEQDPFLLRIHKDVSSAYILDCNNSDTRVSQDDQGTLWFKMDIFVTFLSAASLTFVSLAILSDKRVRSHPNNIIALVCLCDAYTFFQFFNRYIICGYSLNLYLEMLFSWTLLQPYYTVVVKWFGLVIVSESGDVLTWDHLNHYYEVNQYWYGAVAIRLQMWYIISITISYMSLFLSLSTILDLYLVLNSPFSSSEKRIRRFVAVSIILSLLFAILGLKMTRSKTYWISEMNFRIYQGVAITNLLLAVLVMILVILRFRKKKMNKIIQKQLQRRYLEFVVLLALFSWPICYLTKPSYRYQDDIDKYAGGTTYANTWWQLATASFGFIVACSRMRDELLRTKMYNFWMVVTCRQRKQVPFDEFDKLVKETQLNTFLKTSLNTELVITILKGIVILAASTSDKIDHMEDSDLYRIKQTQTIVLENVKITDAKDFSLKTKGGQATSEPQTPTEKFVQARAKKQRLLDSDTEDEEKPDSDVEDNAAANKARNRLSRFGFQVRDPSRTSSNVSDGPDTAAAIDASEKKKKKVKEKIVLPGAKITAYSTSIFQRMRYMDDICFEAISKSLNPRSNADQIFKTGEAAGASGSFFFFSHDRRFIVKTMGNGELQLLLSILPHLHKHLKKNPNSLLSRIYGVYTVEMKDYEKVNLILMGNTLRFDNKNDITRIYDLKGSMFNRCVKGRTTHASTLKDENFVTNQHYVQEVNMSWQDIEKMNGVIKKDSDFLASLNIMDYSILLGIESKIQVNTENVEHTVVNAGRKGSVRLTAELARFKRHRFTSPDGMQTYHVSIIDFLQAWNFNKKAEQFAKTTFMRADKQKLSAVEPETYKKRFQRFMSGQVFIQTNLVSSKFRGTVAKVDRMTSLQRSTDSIRTTSVDQFAFAGAANNVSIDNCLDESQQDIFESNLQNFEINSATHSSQRHCSATDGLNLSGSIVEEHNFFNGASPMSKAVMAAPVVSTARFAINDGGQDDDDDEEQKVM